MKRLIDMVFFSSSLVNSFVVMLGRLEVFQVGFSCNNHEGIEV